MFRRAIAKADEVKILLNHKWDKILGGTKSNLTLREDAIGLRAHAEIDNPEVVQKAKEKKLRGWSFGFTAPTEERAERNGMPIRTITDLVLKEVLEGKIKTNDDVVLKFLEIDCGYDVRFKCYY